MPKAKRIKSTMVESMAFESPISEIHLAMDELVKGFKSHYPEARRVKASGTIEFSFKQ